MEQIRKFIDICINNEENEAEQIYYNYVGDHIEDLYQAAAYNNKNILVKMLSEWDKNINPVIKHKYDQGKSSILCSACELRDFELVKLLIRNGIDQIWEAFEIAIEQNESNREIMLKIATYLVESQIPAVKNKDPEYQSNLLSAACRLNNFGIMEKLISDNINAEDAFYTACINNLRQMAIYLADAQFNYYLSENILLCDTEYEARCIARKKLMIMLQNYLSRFCRGEFISVAKNSEFCCQIIIDAGACYCYACKGKNHQFSGSVSSQVNNTSYNPDESNDEEDFQSPTSSCWEDE